ncbi:MAG: hypothetical protein ACYCO0_00915 [Candidatus Micrarchaeaceae archaeon]
MVYFDIARFGAGDGLCKRLGYKKIYCVGKDVVISGRVEKTGVPLIVISKDPGTLIGAVRDGGVVGIVFDENELTKKVVEKAAEMNKVVYLAVGQLMRTTVQERGFRISRMRKIVLAARKMGARVSLISLADSEPMLLSTMQMSEIARLLFKDASELFGGDVL